MADYRYLFCDALTGTLVEELPLDCGPYSQQISGVGTLTGSLALGELASHTNWRDATIPKRALLVVMRDDRVAWGGLVMKRRPTSGGTLAEVGAETLEGWLGRQEIQADLTYTGVDVFTIVRGILAQVQAVAGGNMRITSGANLAGQVATVTYLGKDNTKALDAINRLAEVAPGFEHTISWSRTGNTFTPTMTLAAPGLANGLDAIVLEYPGNLIDYSYDEDGAAAPNSVTGVGADSAGTPLLARVTDTTEIAAGYPIFYGQIQAKDESDSARLTARTTMALQAGLVDSVVPTAVLRGDADPHFGDFPLGIAARLRATSLYHPAGVNGVPGLDVTRRVTGWTVTPKGGEKVTLALASMTGKITPPRRHRDIGAYLADLDRRVREIATRT